MIPNGFRLGIKSPYSLNVVIRSKYLCIRGLFGGFVHAGSFISENALPLFDQSKKNISKHDRYNFFYNYYQNDGFLMKSQHSYLFQLQ